MTRWATSCWQNNPFSSVAEHVYDTNLVAGSIPAPDTANGKGPSVANRDTLTFASASKQ